MSKGVGKKVAVGAAIAGVAGYVAGVLTAPKSGKETRQDIKNAASKAKTEAEKKLKEVHSELISKLETAKQKGSELTGRARGEFDKVFATAGTAKDKVREVLSAIHEGDADDPDLDKALKDAKDSIKNLEKYLKK